jgi:hypothetical protein
MKSILYVGATLMIGASIYGFVDYKQTSQEKEFSNMYVEEEEKVKEPMVVSTSEKKEAIASDETTAKTKKQVMKKPAVKEEEVIAPIKPIAEDEEIAVTERKDIGESSVDIKVTKDNNIEKKMSKKRKFNTKLFSRGALDERYIEPKKAEKVKTESKKTEDREN